MPKTNPSQHEVERIANKAQERLEYLYDRWQDEKEYEDFKDYVEAASNEVDMQGGEFVSLTKSPFRLTFTVLDDHTPEQRRDTWARTKCQILINDKEVKVKIFPFELVACADEESGTEVAEAREGCIHDEGTYEINGGSK